MHFVYLLRCSDNSLYCGQTANLKRRVNEHNFDKNKGAKYTKNRKPVKLVYFEKFNSLSQALKREIEIKKLSKLNKELLINQ